MPNLSGLSEKMYTPLIILKETLRISRCSKCLDDNVKDCSALKLRGWLRKFDVGDIPPNEEIWDCGDKSNVALRSGSIYERRFSQIFQSHHSSIRT
jgi:hypothetical protein